MIGEYTSCQITQELRMLVNQHLDQINSRLGVCAECWTLNQCWSQQVQGTNYWCWMTADSGDYATVSISVPLPSTQCESNTQSNCENNMQSSSEKTCEPTQNCQSSSPSNQQECSTNCQKECPTSCWPSSESQMESSCCKNSTVCSSSWGHNWWNDQSSSNCVGGYCTKCITNDDRELVRCFRRHINEKVNHSASYWVVNTLWCQESSSGNNYWIQCTSNKGVFATVKICVPGTCSKESPRLTFGCQGHRSWSNWTEKPVMGGWTWKDVQTCDRRQISRLFDTICKESKVSAGSWTLNECQTQTVNGTNYNYTVSSDCGVTAHVYCTQAPGSESQPVFTEVRMC